MTRVAHDLPDHMEYLQRFDAPVIGTPNLGIGVGERRGVCTREFARLPEVYLLKRQHFSMIIAQQQYLRFAFAGRYGQVMSLLFESGHMVAGIVGLCSVIHRVHYSGALTRIVEILHDNRRLTPSSRKDEV